MALSIPIITEFNGSGIKKAIAEFKQLETTSEKAKFAIRKAAVPAAAALAGLSTAALKAANQASDLAEEQQKVGVIFGESAKDVLDFSKKAGRALGQSQRQALAAAGTFGTLGKAAGLTGKDLSGFTTQFTTLASDLASFNNTSPEDAIQAIGAALRGEAEPIRRYGVLLDDATLRNKAFQLGLIRTTKEALTPANKSLAAQAVILEQTRDAQGDFARTSDGAANQQRILAAQVEDATTAIGKAFLPALEKTLPKLADLAEWAAKNPKAISNAAIAVGALAAATVALNAAMAVNPYVAAAGGIVAMGAAFDKLYREIDKVNKVGGVGARILGALFGGPAGAMSGMNKVREGVWSLFGITGKATENMGGLNKAQIENAEINQLVADGLITTNTALATSTEILAGNSKAAKTQTTVLKDLSKAIRADFKSAVEAANDVLGDAKKRFSDFAKSVSDTITGAFSFKDAKDAATETGQTFLEALTDQVTKTQDFAVKINRLLAAGLSEGALQQVLAAGQEAGGAIADELLNGGADAITQANALTAKVQSLGASVGQNAATQFYQGGVDAGNALVQGISAVVSKYRIKLSSKGLSEKQLKRLQRNLGIDVDFLMSGGIPALADGGIVTGPQLALIGEAGPEAVIPLDRMGSMGGITIHVNAGLVSSPDQVGQQIIEAIQKAQRRSGPVFAPA